MNSERARWLVDIGNSRIKCALADARGAHGQVLAIGHDDEGGAERLLDLVGPAKPGDEAWVASVASADRDAHWRQALRAAGLEIHPVTTRASLGSLRIAYAEPSRLGVDRFLALLAASERDGGPWLLVSAGSALTLDLLDADGTHHGGLIAPMPGTMRESLAARFPVLPREGGTPLAFAADTADALASGCEGAVLGLVERSLRLARERLGRHPTLLLAGGDASLLEGLDHHPVEPAPALVIDGLSAYLRYAG